MRPNRILLAANLACLLFTVSVQAHFGMVIPSQNTIDQSRKNLDLTLSFSHPFEGIGMELSKPQKFYLVHEGDKTDLMPTIAQTRVMDHLAWKAEANIKRPGVYHFVMEPQPYWEAAEDLHIIHYTKTSVAAFGEDDGWDTPVGLPTEIVPLLRPFGNYSGNTFSGQVFIHGNPAAETEVEVEFYNRHAEYSSPSDYHITQVVKTDEMGIFPLHLQLARMVGVLSSESGRLYAGGPGWKRKRC